jgi:hypothetical protein
MRMTPKEATAVNVVIGYLAGKDDPMSRQVAVAFETLARRAHNGLPGRLRGRAVTRGRQ